MKKRIISFSCLATLLLMCVACADAGYSNVGKEFLDSAFGGSSFTAKNLLSNHVELGWGYEDASSLEKKDIFMDCIKELKDELSGPFSDFKYRYGYTYDTWGDKHAVAIYSYGTNKECLIALDFDMDYSDEWKICGLDIYEIQDFIDEYKLEKETLSKYLEGGDKEEIKGQKQAVKQAEASIKSIKDLMSEGQISEYNEIKSTK